MVYQTPLVFDPCRQMPPIIDHFKIKLKMVLLLFIYIFYAFSQGSLPRAFGIEKSISSKKKKNKRKKEYQSQYSHYLLIWTFFSFSPLRLIKSTWLHGNVTVVEPEFFQRSIFFRSVYDFVWSLKKEKKI